MQKNPRISADSDSCLAATGAVSLRRRQRLPLIETLEERALFSSITVLNLSDSGAGSLRNAIAAATVDQVIDFAPKLKGTITLTSGALLIDKSLTIDGPGADHLAISGDERSGVFDVTQADATVDIKQLAIVNGLAVGGAGIDNAAGDLSVAYCTFAGNKAVGVAEHGNYGALDADGGAIDNAGGNLKVSYCTFIDNKSIGYPGGNAGGGAILNAGGGTLSVDQSGFSGNAALGGDGRNGGGGAIYNLSDTAVSTTNVNASTFINNRAVGGENGQGLGGAIANGAQGSPAASVLSVTWSTLRGNLAKGGPLARYRSGDGIGAGIWNNSLSSSATIAHCIITGNQAIGGTGGGFGIGGGIANGYGASITVSSCLISNNLALGGAGGGNGFGGGFANVDIDQAIFPSSTPAIIDSTLFLNNRATGGSQGGAGQGGGIYNGVLIVGPVITPPIVSLSVTDSSIAGNQAVGGAAGGGGQGGGVFAQHDSQNSLTQTIVTSNSALGGTGGAGIGGGLFVMAAPDAALFHLIGSIVTGNDASTRKNNISGLTD